MKKILLLTLLFGTCLFASEPFYYRIDKSKGLPSNTVFDIFQDSKGFIWYAGSFGICRYDGKNLKEFNMPQNAAIAGTGIQEDSEGRIWYCNFDGKVFYLQNGQVQQLKQKNSLGFLYFGIIKDNIYVVEKNEVAIYNSKYLHKTHVIPLNTDKVLITSSNKHSFYILSDELYIVNYPYRVQVVKLPTQLKQNLKGVVLKASEDELIIASKYSNRIYSYRNGRFTSSVIQKPEFVQNISLGKTGFWLCSTSGIMHFNSKLNNNANVENVFEGSNISDVLVDKDGNYWVSTLNNGVRFVPDLRTQFVYMSDYPTNVEAAGDNILYGNVNNALYLSNVSFSAPKSIGKGESNHAVYMLKYDSAAGNIFATSNSFKWLNKASGLRAESKLAVKDLVKLDDAYYAFSATGHCGVFKTTNLESEWDAVFKNYSSYTEEKFKFLSIIGNVRGKSVTFNPQTKTIYFSTNKGLFCLQSGRLKQIKRKGEQLNIVKLVTTPHCVLALSVDGQLYRIQDSNQTQKINFGKQLNGGKIIGMKQLGSSTILLTTNSIYSFEHHTLGLRKVFALNDDFELYDITRTNSHFIISTSKGFIVKPDSFYSVSTKPFFKIDSVLVNDKKITQTSNLLFKASENNISFCFSNYGYDSGSENFVFYKFNTDEWKKITDNRSSIDFKALRPGEYTLELMFGNGTVNSGTQKIIFTIDKPFWMQWWFVALLIVLAAIALYYVDKWRSALIRNKSQEIINRIELEKTANRSKLKAIKSQMNPHFFFNALNTIQSFILDNDKKLAVNYLNKFSTLTRSILEMSDRDEVSVEEEIKVLKLYLDIEKARFDGDFEYEITYNDFDREMMKVPTLLIQPYVENAVKHGLLHKQGLKKLHINFVKESKELRIIISDNGIGRKMSMELNAIKRAKHQSFATQATDERVGLLNQSSAKKISIQYVDEANEPGHSGGTTVIITVLNLTDEFN